MNFIAPLAFFLQSSIFEELQHSGPLAMVVLGILVCFSIYSWTVIFAKWQSLRGARNANARFLRAFRKANGLEAVMVASEQFRPSPLVSVFDFGYEEIERQVKARGKVTNQITLERTLQLGVSEELAKLERNMNWLATTASAPARSSACSARCWASSARFRIWASRAAPACGRWGRASPRRSSPPP